MVKSYLPYGKQSIDITDIKSVIRVLKSDYLTTGPVLKLFERSIKNYCGCKFSVGTNSATSALHIACLALGIKRGDLVWTTPITFAATANCALYCGATIDFVDIDLETFNISAEFLEKKLVLAQRKGKLPKVLIPVHLGGQSCEMDKIKSLSKKFGFKIIEDASHALGGKYKKAQVGSCTYSDITIFSFHPVKIITTGEGGIAVTNNKKLANKMLMFREHGIERNPKNFVGKNNKPWVYQQQALGFNYRLSDVHAAIGLSQLRRIDRFIKKRNQISAYYIKKLCELPIKFQKQKSDIFSTRHLFIILVSKKNHLKLFSFLRSKKILVNLHYMPVYLHPYYRSMNYNGSQFKNSMDYYKSAISLPVYYNLKKNEQRRVINLIKKFYKQYNSN